MKHCAALLLFLPLLLAQVPQLLRLRGEAPAAVLTRADFRPGQHSLVIAWFGAEKDETPLFAESLSAHVDATGHYSVLAGERLPPGFFSQENPRWVEVSLAGFPAAQRVRVDVVPYALKAADAETLDGLPPAAFLRFRDEFRQFAAPAAPRMVSSGTINFIGKFNNSLDLRNSGIFENSSGNVGIGTVAPVGKLNISGGAGTYITLSAFQIDQGDKGFLVRAARGTASAPLAVNNGNTLFNLYAQGYSGTTYLPAAAVNMSVDGTVSAGRVPGAIRLQTMNSGGSLQTRLIVNSAGNVGIASSAPSQRLEVNGNLRIMGAGNGLVFPDASTQSTAAIIGNGDILQVSTPAGSGLAGGANSGAVTLSIPAGGITNSMLANNSVTDTHIAGLSINPNAIAGYAAGINAANSFSQPVTMIGNFNAGNGFGGFRVTQLNNGSVQRVAGHWGNTATTGFHGVLMGGGEPSNASSVSDIFGFVGGGAGNGAGNLDSSINNAAWGAVSGGRSNGAGSPYGAVLAGQLNGTAGSHASVVGGEGNIAEGSWSIIGAGDNNYHIGDYATIGSGANNQTWDAYNTIFSGANNQTFGEYSVILGGRDNTVNATRGFAAGKDVLVNHAGSFVFADYQASAALPFASAAVNEFAVRARGGVRLVTAVQTTGPSAGVSLAAGSGTWASLSDRHAKENIRSLDPQAVLTGLLQVPVLCWNYRTQSAAIRHLGPMAQDFFRVFQLGPSEKTIDDVDGQGVALAAIQAVDQRTQSLREEIEALKATLAELSKNARLP
jgi:hypothetical protein